MITRGKIKEEYKVTIKDLYEYCKERNIENYPIFINYNTGENEYFLSEYITKYDIRYGDKINDEEMLGEPSLILDFSIDEFD